MFSHSHFVLQLMAQGQTCSHLDTKLHDKAWCSFYLFQRFDNEKKKKKPVGWIGAAGNAQPMSNAKNSKPCKHSNFLSKLIFAQCQLQVEIHVTYSGVATVLCQ